MELLLRHCRSEGAHRVPCKHQFTHLASDKLCASVHILNRLEVPRCRHHAAVNTQLHHAPCASGPYACASCPYSRARISCDAEGAFALICQKLHCRPVPEAQERAVEGSSPVRSCACRCSCMSSCSSARRSTRRCGVRPCRAAASRCSASEESRCAQGTSSCSLLCKQQQALFDNELSQSPFTCMAMSANAAAAMHDLPAWSGWRNAG